MSNSSHILTVRNLTVRRGKHELLRNVSFDLQCGELKGVFGPSGAGKSTLLHAIAGVTDPALNTAGEIHYNGASIHNMPADERSRMGIAVVMQGLHLFPDMSVLENVSYPLKRRGYTLDRIEEKSRATLESLHILSLAHRAIGTLSGGQQQRVALARALVYDPSLLLLDEPFNGLEQDLRDQLLADISLRAREGVSVLFVTHEKRELRLIADSVLELRQGRLADFEHRKPLDAQTPFDSLEDWALLPVGMSEETSFLRAHIVGIEKCRAPESDIGSSGGTVSAKVVIKRTCAANTAALLVQYEVGYAGWIDVSASACARIGEGDWVSIRYTNTLVGRSNDGHH